MLKYALLGFLTYGDMTGYDLKQNLDHSTQFFWQAEQSQIYRTLKGLEADGLVTSQVEEQDDRPNKRIYHLTEAGHVDFHNWVSTPTQDISLHKDAFLLKVFFSAENDRDEFRAQLLLQRRLHERQADLYREDIAKLIQVASTEHNKQAALFWEATRRFGERYTQMYIAWINDVLDMLDNTTD